MADTKTGDDLSGPIAASVVAKLKKRGKGFRGMLDAIAAGRDMHEQMAGRQEFGAMPPAFAAYLLPQIQASILTEQLAPWKEVAPLTDLISQAEETYMPSGPPISPLTSSYFTSWSLFDACAGSADETMGTTILAIGKELGMDPGILRSIRVMQDSRMGLYLYTGKKAGLATLQDIVTGVVLRASVPSGDCGQKGELWYVRLLPGDNAEHVAFTTPYVIVAPDVTAWREYFRRTIPLDSPAGQYERHMKFGPARDYWNEYIFEAYVNHRAEAVYLAGLPDVPESRPHSRISEANGWAVPEGVSLGAGRRGQRGSARTRRRIQ